MIGIIGAMKEEISAIKATIRNLNVIEHATRTFYQGTIHNHGVVLVQAGIGKVNAAITTTLLVEQFNVNSIINIGVAGGQNGVHHKDIIISESTLYHDADVTKFGSYVAGQIPGEEPEFRSDKSLVNLAEQALKKLSFPYKKGRIASGDQFVYESTKIEKVNNLYTNIYAIDMESASIAHVANTFKKPCLIIRSISDVLDDETQATDFNTFVQEASDKAGQLLLEMLDLMQ
jgi:adenosylhomocysteine nucleosidase